MLKLATGALVCIITIAACWLGQLSYSVIGYLGIWPRPFRMLSSFVQIATFCVAFVLPLLIGALVVSRLPVRQPLWLTCMAGAAAVVLLNTYIFILPSRAIPWAFLWIQALVFVLLWPFLIRTFWRVRVPADAPAPVQ